MGPLKGTSLTLIPASVVPWSTWEAGHPATMVMANILDRERLRVQLAPDDFVIGVALDDSATAYEYRLAAERLVINDRVGDHPVGVFVDSETHNIKVYLRRPADAPPGEAVPAELTFAMDGEAVVDLETGSEWGVSRGFAVAVPLKGAVLQKTPYVTAFVWAWHNSFPPTAVYGR